MREFYKIGAQCQPLIFKKSKYLYCVPAIDDEEKSLKIQHQKRNTIPA